MQHLSIEGRMGCSLAISRHLNHQSASPNNLLYAVGKSQSPVTNLTGMCKFFTMYDHDTFQFTTVQPATHPAGGN